MSIVRASLILLLAASSGCGKFADFATADGIQWKSGSRTVTDPITGDKFPNRFDSLKAKKDLGSGVLEMPIPIMGEATIHLLGGAFGGKSPQGSQLGEIGLVLKEREGTALVGLFASFFEDGVFVRAQSEFATHGNFTFLGAQAVELRVESKMAAVRYLAREEGEDDWMEIGTSAPVDLGEVHVPAIAVGLFEKGTSIGVDDFSVPVNLTDPLPLSDELKASLSISTAKESVRQAVRELDGFRNSTTVPTTSAFIDDALSAIDGAITATSAVPGSKSALKSLANAAAKLKKGRKQLNKGTLKQKKVDKVLDKLDDACCELIKASVMIFPPTTAPIGR